MYYKIGEMAKKLNIAPSVLRYYDKEGLLPFVQRSEGGVRLFTDRDFDWLLIVDCLKKTGMPIKDIKTFIGWVIEGDDTIDNRLKMFISQRKNVEEQLAQMQETLSILIYKCWYYEMAKAAGTTDVPRGMQNKDLPDDIRPHKEKYDRIKEAG